MSTETTTGDKVGAIVIVLLVAAGLIGWALDHWQWALIIPIVGMVAYGLIKFGWDAATAVDKKARE